MPKLCLQLMDVAVKLPPFKAPKVAVVEFEAAQLLPLPELLDEEVQGHALETCLACSMLREFCTVEQCPLFPAAICTGSLTSIASMCTRCISVLVLCLHEA